MKTSPIRIALIAATLVFATAGTANAVGCLKGAVVGGALGTMRGTTLSLVRSVAAWSAGTLRSSTPNSKLRSVRQHRRNKTSSAWCTRWSQKIAGPPGT
jgi:hypothetical protein